MFTYNLYTPSHAFYIISRLLIKPNTMQVPYQSVQFSSFQSLSCVQLLRPHESQQARPPCPSPSPGVYSNSCPWSRWCHSTISSSVIPFSSHLQSFPASGSFQMSQPFASGGKHEKTILNIAPHKHFFSIKWYKLLGWGFFSVSCHLMLWLIHLALYDKGQERKENSLKYMYQYWVRSQIH